MARSDSLSTRLAPVFERRIYRDAGELLLVGLAFLLYFVVRANVIDRPDLALQNAGHIVDAEKALGIFNESGWQASIHYSRPLIKFFNFIYLWLDFPLIAVVGLLMYWKRRRVYTFTRDAILFSGACALIAYALFPVAPPRLNPDAGLIDTLQAYNNLSYLAQSTSFFVNPYAAMPSLHVGWAVLLAIGVAMAFGNAGKKGKRSWLIWFVLLLAVLHPITQWTSTVMTGNHYFLDGVGGLVAAALGLVFATFMQRRGYGWLGRRVTSNQ
jgi:membrane-associated phospholipid phosphatase